MTEIFKMMLSLSLSASILILAALLCCRLLRNRLSKRWQYYIWLVVVLRLLIPYSPEGSVIGRVFGEQRPVSESRMEDRTPAPEAENPAVPDNASSLPESATAAGGTREPAAPVSPPPVAVRGELSALLGYLWIPWLLVTLILLIRKITLYQSFAKYIKAGKTEVSDLNVLNLFGKICEQTGVQRPIELYTNGLIASPLLMGILKPCVVLPALPADERELRYICLHELTHYRRRDIYYKWLLQIALCLHWFNPLVHLMVREANRVCELSCDEAVIRFMDAVEKRLYGDVLLESLKTPGEYREGIAALTLNENTTLLKERLEAIMKFRGNKKWTAVVAILLSACLFAGGYLLGAYTARPEPAAPQEEQIILSDEGLPIMSAQNRIASETYLDPIAITGALRKNWSPEDFGSLFENGSSDLMHLVDALAQEEITRYEDGNIPAPFVDELLCNKFPLFPDKVREICGDIYDAETDTYHYIWGLGGGPAVPIVTGYEENGKLLTIYYTWYVGDPAADTFRYRADDSGELIVELSGNDFRYRSNKVIEREADSEVPGEGYNIREQYGMVVLNDRHEMVLSALTHSQILQHAWKTPEEIEPDGFVHLYYMLGNRPYSEFDWVSTAQPFEDQEGYLLIPANELEPVIQKHFSVSAAHMRTSGYYMAEKDCYWFGGMGSVANVKLTGVTEDGDIHSISYEAYSDITLMGTGVLRVRMSDDLNFMYLDYEYLSNEYVPAPLTEEQQALRETLVTVGPDMALEEKILAVLTKTGCGYASWQDAEELETGELLLLVEALVQTGDLTLPEDVERDPLFNGPVLPAKEAERIVQEYFTVSTDYLRTYYRYDAERGVYALPNNLYGTDCRLVKSTQDGNVLTIQYEIYQPEVFQKLKKDYEGIVTVELLPDGGWRYLSCQSEWVG